MVKSYSIFIILIVLLILLSICVNIRKELFTEDQICNSDYCSDHINVNRITKNTLINDTSAIPNDHIEIVGNVDIQNVNTNSLNLNSKRMLQKNADDNTQIGDELLNVAFKNDTHVEFENRSMIKPHKLHFNSNTIFMNNVYFNDPIILQQERSLCFYDNSNINCVNQNELEEALSLDVVDLEQKRTLLRGACVSTEALDGTLNREVFNPHPLDNRLTCLDDVTGISRLGNWYKLKKTYIENEEIEEDTQ
jgi:hypothetical protein